MADLEQQLQSMLSDPELMSRLFSMAGALGGSAPAQNPPQQPSQTSLPFDPGAMQHMMALLQQIRLEPRQQQLLSALAGYLPPNRLRKLEKAMQSAKIARFAAMTASRSQGR